MSANDRRRHEQLLEETIDAIDEHSSEPIRDVWFEYRLEDTAVDALVMTGGDQESQMDVPLHSEHEPVFEWFAQEERRDPEDLYATTEDPEDDRELVEDLLECDVLAQNEDGTCSVARPLFGGRVVAVEVAEEITESTMCALECGARVAHERWLVMPDAEGALLEDNEIQIGVAEIGDDGQLEIIQDSPTQERPVRIHEVIQ